MLVIYGFEAILQARDVRHHFQFRFKLYSEKEPEVLLQNKSVVIKIQTDAFKLCTAAQLLYPAVCGDSFKLWAEYVAGRQCLPREVKANRTSLQGWFRDLYKAIQDRSVDSKSVNPE